MKRVHLDHNATTPMRPEVRALFLETIDALSGNPSSVHRSGRAARQVLDEARERIAAALQAHEDEIVFTSGGTESIHLAILGAVRPLSKEKGLVTTAVEHSAVLGAAGALEREGHPVQVLRVDRQGRPDLPSLFESARDPHIGLISVMAANNEVGTLMPIGDIAAHLDDLGRSRPLFHTDAVQALGRIPVDLGRWRADMASFSVHKLGGPLGVGLLYRRKGVSLSGLMFGGGQESGLRPGTENVPAIAAAALAVELAVKEQAEYAARTRELSLSFWRQLQSVLPRVELHGPPIESDERLSNTLNIGLFGIDGRVLVTRLDLEGLEASAGSACASGSLEPSHVLRAMGFDDERARSGLRLSFGRTTDARDINSAVDILRRTLVSSR